MLTQYKSILIPIRIQKRLSRGSKGTTFLFHLNARKYKQQIKIGEKTMLKMTSHSKRTHIPSWKQLTLATAIFLSTGPFVAITSGQAAYAQVSRHHGHNQSGHTKDKNIVKRAELTGTQKRFNLLNILVVCTAGDSGDGGVAIGNSSGANGGPGGNCNITIPVYIK
jgi:hypothetical protein